MSERLRDKTRKGFFWSTLERISTQGIQFIFGIILARILSPTDYGIIAMPIIFLNLAQVFIDSGFSNALIRKKDLRENDLTTAFLFNVIVGAFCYTILFICSPLIASFYNTPILKQILRITALTILFSPLCAVQQAIVTIKLNFKVQAKITGLAALISGIIGVIMAYSGYGVWSLVLQQVMASLIRVILMWMLVKWKPKGFWSKNSFKYLWDFGSKMMVSSLINTIYQNIYPLIIGKYYVMGELGFFTRAQQFSQLPSSNFTGIIKRVTYPVLSSLQDDNEELIRKFRKTLRAAVFIIFPVMFGLFAVSDPLIKVVLTEKWMPVVPLLRILCVAMVWYPIDALNLNLLMIKGRSDLFLRLEIIKKIFGVIVLFLCIGFGIEVLCISLVIYSIFEIITDTYYSGKYFNIGLKKQMIDIIPSLLISMLMVIIVMYVNTFISNSIFKLITDCLIGPLIYLGTCRILKMRELSELKIFLR